ncbi:MAG: hypothetical protein HND39_08380 [Ignavibacteriota bacterium]|nr:MAG: hypothetical protein EDM72_00780 [Chlorobiota bacterium]MBE7476293.1 hypothetical protein [Ignavibacteriales bacterium]MBL1124224.1 hypothetical protein [Ignavibacteriota bacterium]MCC7093181.1 hypothetical protein [Ignavibacteriaceae bacterium]MCE7855846.1 hypothetical protein [Ignavibacteria bacterium CHB3]MEB2296966.1 hypothetical protein [Ignavibacteria bacterium]
MNEKDFIFSKSKDLSLSGLKNFPQDFTFSKKINSIDVPEKVLSLGKEFFGSFEVTSATGDFVMTFQNEFEAKYVVYASQNRKNLINIPADQSAVINAVKEYEKYLDNLLLEIKNEYQRKVNNGKNLTAVSNEIFKKLNLTRL